MAQTRGRILAGAASVAVLVVAAAWTVRGQFVRPKYTSAAASVATSIAGKNITIDYYAPSMHGRKIIGGLVSVGGGGWPGGARGINVTTQADPDKGRLKVPPGSYTLWNLPAPKQMVLILNKPTPQL